MKKEKFSNETIGDKARIPDGDVIGWIESLRDAGLSNDEIDAMISRLNKTYREKSSGDYVEEELKKIEETVKSHGGRLSEEQKEYLRKSTKERE